MTKVTILPVFAQNEQQSYLAVAGDKQSLGSTVGEALDAVMSQLQNGESSTFVIVQQSKPDKFFDAEQQAQLAQLMNDWREARDTNVDFPESAQAELERLLKPSYSRPPPAPMQ